MKHLGRLQHLAVRAKHGRAAQAELHELQGHDAIVHIAELDPAEFDHVDLDAAGGQLVEQRLDEPLRHVMKKKRAVAQVDADDAERLLLQRSLRVEHAHVHDDLAGLRRRGSGI